jgi:hypothetical protein
MRLRSAEGRGAGAGPRHSAAQRSGTGYGVVSWFGEILDIKGDVLHQLLLPPAEQAWSGAPAEQLSRLRHSTFFGLPPITTVTFNELLSTGKVNLLRSGELRGELASYYAFYTRLTAILDVLPGSYRAIVWASLPGDAEHRARRDAAAADTATVRLGLARLGGNPQLRDAVNHELYYSAGLRSTWRWHNSVQPRCCGRWTNCTASQRLG